MTYPLSTDEMTPVTFCTFELEVTLREMSQVYLLQRSLCTKVLGESKLGFC